MGVTIVGRFCDVIYASRCYKCSHVCTCLATTMMAKKTMIDRIDPSSSRRRRQEKFQVYKALAIVFYFTVASR